MVWQALQLRNLKKFINLFRLGDTFGNHNFDRSVEHLAKMMELANSTKEAGKPYEFVCANLKSYEKVLPLLKPFRIVTVGGVKVGIVGIMNTEAPTLISPTAMGPITITEPVAAAMKAKEDARKAGADVVVCIVHMGVEGFDAKDK
jgi:5'-nucleotidase